LESSFNVPGKPTSSTSEESRTSRARTVNLLHVNAMLSSERELERKSEIRYSSGELGGGSSGM